MKPLLEALRLILPSKQSFAAHLVIGTVLLNLVVVVLAGLSVYFDKLDHEERAAINTHNVALLLEGETSAMLGRIDLALTNMAEEVEDELRAGRLDPVHLNGLLIKLQSHLPEIVSLRMTDAQGIVRYGQGVHTDERVDLSDREFFKNQRDDAKAGLFIGHPVLARISREWAIPISHRLSTPAGDFAGIVYANVSVAYLVTKFSELKLGEHGLVSLRSADHLTLARYPVARGGSGVVGQYALSGQLQELVKSDPDSVTYLAASPVDDIVRTFSYKKIGTHRLYVIVGQARQDYLSEWRRHAIGTLAVVPLFSLMSVLFTWLLIRAWRRQLKNELALRADEERWSMALEGGSFVVWDWNLETDEVVLSKAGKQLFGFAEDEIGDRMSDWLARCHPEDAPRVMAALKEHFHLRAPRFVAEFRVKCKDGSWKWVLSRGLVVRRLAGGKPLRMIGTHVDVNERREREERLRLAATVFEIADEAVVVTDPDNRIVSVNPAFETITGYSADEVIGQNPSLLSAKTLPKAFYEEMWKSLVDTGGWRGEVLNRKKSGETYVEWLSLKRLLDDEGRATHHVAVFSDISQRKQAEERMRYLALHDALTGLPNRSLMSDRLNHCINVSRRDKTRFALLYFDLDKFKPVNDKLGHEVGDALLVAVAQRVQECVRESDTVARVGGDEFVALLPKLQDSGDAMRLAEKIRDALSQPFHVAGHVCDISASIGIALYPEHGEDEKQLTLIADAAMYQAKQNGRNCVVVYQAGKQAG